MEKKRTKIVCTIGPASESVEVLTKMVKAGMNVARLNFSHGTYTNHKKLITNLRKVSKQTGNVITILQDLQGPRIRLGELPEEGVKVKKGDIVIFTTSKKIKGRIPVTYNRLHREVKKGDRILVADGLFEFVVEKIRLKDIYCKVVNGGKLISHKGMNFPDTALSISSLHEKDIADLEFGVKNKVDFVALSFVRDAKDVNHLRVLIAKFKKKYKIAEKFPIQIIVKIEKPEAVVNFDSILQVADGVMVARGDLGIEMPAQDVPLLQKEFIEKCNQASKPVIVATQMLESMISNPIPTRAEVSDVANAIIDHTDAVMLSGESAIGKYPVQAVQTLSDIALETEKSKYDNLDYSDSIWQKLINDEAIVSSAAILSTNMKAGAMVVLSISGETARLISKYRPELPIFVTTNSARVQRQLNLSWGVEPLLVSGKDIDVLYDKVIKVIKQRKIAKNGDEIILVKGNSLKKDDQHLRSIEILTI